MPGRTGWSRGGVRAVVAGKPVPKKETRKRKSAATGRIQRHRGGGYRITKVIEEIRSYTSIPAV
jgi:hypothetical protein